MNLDQLDLFNHGLTHTVHGLLKDRKKKMSVQSCHTPVTIIYMARVWIVETEVFIPNW